MKKSLGRRLATLAAGLLPVVPGWPAAPAAVASPPHPAAATRAAAPLQAAPGQFYPARTRIMDAVTIPAKTTIPVLVTGVAGVPVNGVSAVAVNFAVGGNGGSGGLVAYPADGTQPAVTGATYQGGVYNHQLLVVPAGARGIMNVANTGPVSAIVFADIFGYFSAQPLDTPGSTYVPLDTARIVSKVSVPANGSYVLSPLGKGGLPAGGVTAVAFALIAKSTAAGKLTPFPTGSTQPPSTVLDYRANQFVSNMVFGQLAADGTLTIANSGAAAVDIYVDVAGYFAAPGSAAAGSALVPVTPVRTLSAATIAANGSLTVAPLGTGGVPASGAPAVALNVTTKSTGSGSLRIHPSGQANPPSGGSVDYLPSDYYAQYVPAKLGADGKVVIVNAGSAKVTVWLDTYGYFAAPRVPSAPAAVTATAGDGQATVGWPAPADGGAAITGYLVTPAPSGSPVQVDGASTTATVPGLSNGQSYTFTVTATNAVGTGPASAPSAPVTPQPAGPVTARFTASCDATTRACQFDASASGSSAGAVTGYDWSFGDGDSAAGPATSHTYRAGGTYLVVLTVTDATGATGTAQETEVFAAPPVAVFTTACDNATLTCTFDASDSTAPGAGITGYAWDFGDGSTGAGRTSSHTFQSGSHRVTLTVTGSNGLTGTAARTITIGPADQAPTAAFTPDCTGNLFCGFDGSASADPDGEVTSYTWDFGDGATGRGERASHVFAAAGTYTVTLVVTDDDGATGHASATVRVTGGGDGTLRPRFSYLCAYATECDFDASGSTDDGGTIAGYAWDFGDGAAGSGPTVSHTYAAAGTYQVTLTVTDDKGNTAARSDQVTVTG